MSIRSTLSEQQQQKGLSGTVLEGEITQALHRHLYAKHVRYSASYSTSLTTLHGCSPSNAQPHFCYTQHFPPKITHSALPPILSPSPLFYTLHVPPDGAEEGLCYERSFRGILVSAEGCALRMHKGNKSTVTARVFCILYSNGADRCFKLVFL